MCDSRWWSSMYDSQYFSEPQRQDKTALMKQNKLLRATLLPSNCFCYPGSNVSCNGLGMRVYLMMVWSRVFSYHNRAKVVLFFLLVLPFCDSRGDKERMLFICVWRTVVARWTWCDFVGPFVWLSGPLRLKLFPPVGFSAHLVLWDAWNIKKAVCDLTI